MLTLIITQGNISQEFELTSSFDKENLQGITSLNFQDETQTIHIEALQDSFAIFSKITDILISKDIQDIQSLQSFLQDLSSKEQSEETALQELQELLKDNDLNFEIIALENAKAQGNNEQSSTFLNQSEEETQEQDEQKDTEERTKLDLLSEEEEITQSPNNSNKSFQNEESSLLSPSSSSVFTPSIPVITDIIDTNGDFSSIIMHGEGEEVGNIITLYDEDNNLLTITTVTSLLTWSIDISSLGNTPINDNEFFRVTQQNVYGLTSAFSEATHFNHYNWTNAQTDDFDDYALAGSGNDRLYVNDDDLNDRVVADGGDGVDKLVFTGNKEDYTITHNLDGSVSILEDSSSDSNGDGIGDETIARNVEELVFDNGSIFTNTLVSPIAFDLNNDGIIGVTGETSSINKNLNAVLGRTVNFDINNDGVKDQIEWFDGNGDGILVDNRDNMAAVDMNGSRLFGDESGKYSNGYDKLATFDTNKDNILSQEELDGLSIWIDDGDAKVEKGELKSLKELGIESISTQMNEVTNNEGKTFMQSIATKDDGSTILSEDVWFQEKSNDTVDLENINSSSLVEESLKSDISKINIEALLNTENENDELVILGSKNGKIILEGGVKSDENNEGHWEKLSSKNDEEGNTFNIYQSSNGDSIIKLLIDDNIDINDI